MTKEFTNVTNSEKNIPLVIEASRKRAVGYIRVSDPRQEDKYGPDTQREDIENYCKAQGYILVEIYYEAVTGIIWRERRELTKLRLAASKRELDAEFVVVGRFDRLAREDDIQTVIMEDLAYHGVKVESATEKIEDSPAGRFMLHVYGFLAGEDRRRMLKRTDDGRRQRGKQGHLLGGGVPLYGYIWGLEGKTYEINSNVVKVDKNKFRWTEAEIVKYVFHAYAEGVSISSISAILTEKGIPTRKGGTIWHHSVLHRMLANPYYMGKAAVYRRHYQKITGKEYKTHCEWRSEEDQIHLPEGVVPSLVDQETFETVQAQLARNKELATRNAKNPQDALLRCGLIYCGYCGTRMTMMHSGKRPTVYCCATYHKRIGKCVSVTIVANIIDTEVWNYAKDIIRNPLLIEQALKEQKKEDNTERDLSPIERSLAKVERKIKNYKRTIDSANAMSEYATLEDEDVINGIIDDAVTQIKALEKERRALEKQKAQVLVERTGIEEEREAIEKFRGWCTQYREKLDDPNYEPTYDEKRRACERIGIKVKVWRTDHSPRYEITALPTDIESQA